MDPLASMRAMLAALLLALAPKHVEMRIPETPWVVALDIAETTERLEAGPFWDENGKEWGLLAAVVGKRNDIVLIRTVSDLSAGLTTYKFGTPFDVRGLHCYDASVYKGDIQAGNMTAIVELPGLRVQLQRMSVKGKLERREFESLAQSFRVLLLRRGTARDYPEALCGALMQCAASSPGREAWTKGFLARHPTDWFAHLAEAEFRRLEKAPATEQIESYERAAMLFSKLTSLKPPERCARALCNEGLGLAHYDAQKFPESASALEQACADLLELKRPELAEVTYELALSQCRAGSLEVSLAALRRAVASEPKLRERAAAEPYFEGLRKLPEFLELIAPTAPPPAK
jgi:hypothetical protein